jgi:hypothetical protein
LLLGLRLRLAACIVGIRSSAGTSLCISRASYHREEEQQKTTFYDSTIHIETY